jgi:hypothetical protein
MKIDKESLYKKQDGKCYYCNKDYPKSLLTINHFVPKTNAGIDSKNNLILCCSECNVKNNDILPYNETQLIQLLKQLLDKHPDFRSFRQEVNNISSEINFVADILVEQKINGDWIKVLIEVKSLPTFTSKRILEITHKLNEFKKLYKNIDKIALCFPGVLADEDYEILKRSNIEIWDRLFILNTFKNELNRISNKNKKISFYDNFVKTTIDDDLINELRSISAGKEDWHKYQKHIGKILSYLFNDDLSDPITELPDNYGINRRDFILRNYCENGFWKYLREKYQADFIVIDAKNYVGKIKKNQVLQISNYLKPHGAGLFAIIISRNGEEDRGSFLTRKEKWIIESKMIIILNDNDIINMILTKAYSDLPEELLIQKIENFRLGM